MKKARLIVFVKAPVAGKVKTRLGASVGMLNAARLYKLLCYNYLKKVSLCPEVDVEVWASPDTHHPFFLRCRRELGITIRRQPSGSLGERMYRSIQVSLRSCSTVILTGSDMPDISGADLKQAISSLDDSADVVFSPAFDGGYGLVAMKKPVKSIFYGMHWSCSNVLDISLRRLERQKHSVRLLPAHIDIDTLSDYRKYLRE